MLKVLAAVLAVLSAAISITIYSATLPAVQKQEADNAEKIEQIESALENTPQPTKYYNHNIKITSTDTFYFNIISSDSGQFNNDKLKKYLTDVNGISLFVPKSTLSSIYYIYNDNGTIRYKTHSVSVSGGNVSSTEVDTSVFSSIQDTVNEI